MRAPLADGVEIWGDGQQRQCRDWSKLVEWANSHNSCFLYLNETQGVDSSFERYKFCPEGSPYAERMRSVMGLSSEALLQRPKEMDSLPRYWEEF